MHRDGLGNETQNSRDPALRLFLQVHGLLPRVRQGLYRFKFGLAAFLTPLGIRAIPEIIVGPYPVGFDTIAFYVPSTLDLASGMARFNSRLPF